MRWPAWIHDALNLGPNEVDRVRPGLPTDELRLLASASEQPDEAVELLVRRLRHSAPPARRRPLLALVPVVLVVAMVLVAVQWSLDAAPPAYGEIAVELHERASMSALQTLELGPSIRVSGLGELAVEQADERDTRVRLYRGSARFDVDPAGAHRALTVLAADTAVRVTGTQFIVHHLYDSVYVEVLRGSVEIERDGVFSTVVTGDRWTHRGTIAALSVVSEPQSEPQSEVGRMARVHPAGIDRPVDTASVPLVEADAPGTPDIVVVPPVPVATNVGPTREPAVVTAGESFAQILDALDNAGSPASVARALDAFLLQHPTSSMAPEAAALRLELAAELEPPRVVVTDLEVWLRANPQHPRRLAMLELQATLARDRMQDCDLALPPYRLLAVEAPVRLAARAEALRGLCALETGQRDEARTALARAIALGVGEPLSADVAAAQARLGQR